MSKKERMLKYISNNVKWFLSTDSSVEVIPYYDMSNAVFLRVKEYIGKSYIDFDEVVCLVSTSILESGKSGILFTTDAMYCKSWGLLTKKCQNYYFSYEIAEFDFHNDFYKNRMKELMKDLNDISVDEDESSRYDQIFNEILDKGAKVGAAILGGMAVADIVSLIGDNMVSQNNSKIANEIAALEEDNPDAADTIRIYEEFFPLIDQLVENFERAEEEGEDISKDTYYAMISSLNDILLELYYQTLENIDISPEDEEEYTRYANWLSFWALLFYDNDQFRISHSIELLEDMPEFWDMVVNLVDKILEDEWEDSFSNKVYDFARTAINNSEEILELMSSSDWDDDFWDSLSELVESNNQAVKSLSDVLDRITDYFNEFLRTIDEE